MKKVTILLTILILAISLSGCCLSHDWVEATCTEPKTCSKCGKTEGKTLEHSWSEPLFTQSSCVVHGTIRWECLTCGKQYEKELPLIDHDYKEVVNSASECITTYKCSVCNKILKKENHAWKLSASDVTSVNYNKKELTGLFRCSQCKSTKTDSTTVDDANFESMYCAAASQGSYDSIARYPEKQQNKFMKFSGYILQDCGGDCYRMSTSGKYNDAIYVEFVGTRSGGRILEGDHVTVYGQPNLLYTYESVMGASITIPKFKAYYLK